MCTEESKPIPVGTLRMSVRYFGLKGKILKPILVAAPFSVRNVDSGCIERTVYP